MAACVAVISDTNQLLYLQTAECSDPIFYHFKVHAALDVIEDKLAKRAAYSSNSLEQTDQYLGLLYPMEDHRLYGYVTNTQVKFIIVQEAHAPQVASTQSTGSPQSVQQYRDSEIRSFFQRLHTAYVDLVSSPFYTPKTPILPDSLAAAARFHKQVADLLAPRASSGNCPIMSLAVWDTNMHAVSMTSTATSRS
ncbi:trafficking protein particle complex subunit 2 [Paragonimus westermani]|uniref:Trafficking protein particle complex subunit 2-like protein n=1 Tax=Paragonimus westermani TaxID=34504 RepID=A0A5J4NW69_9TREM|nr:trafficking protein particle complex subunit 2 [Paragonimus westermani]